MRVTVRQLKRIISEAMRPDINPGAMWRMGSSTNHDQEVYVIEPRLGDRRPSVGAQIAYLWSEFKNYPEGRGVELGTDKLARFSTDTDPARRWKMLVDLFEAFLNTPNKRSENPALKSAFESFVSHLRTYVTNDVAIAAAAAAAADEAYESYATTEEAAANEAARKRSEALSAPRQSDAAMPSVATESLRRDLRRRLRSL